MKNHYSLILICLLLCLQTITVRGQEVIAALGNSAKNTQASISWTVGETVTSTIKTRNNTLTYGFHQGRLIVTAIDQIAAAVETKAGGNWFDAAGYSFDFMTAGDGYWVFAFPAVDSGVHKVYSMGKWNFMTEGAAADYIINNVVFDNQVKYKIYSGCNQV